VIVAGSCVEVPTSGFGLPRDFSHAAALGALEEHVLENVGNPAPAIRLVEESRLDVSNDRNYRSRVVCLNQEREPV
jgi:hypothetical protein